MSALSSRLSYYKRVFQTYIVRRGSNLSFWHGTPQINENAFVDELGQYYMPFSYKADYTGPFDDDGVPLLDYSGNIGRQYNPIAVAQYGLAHFNRFKDTGQEKSHDAFLRQAEWLVSHLEENPRRIAVWNHWFDWEYRDLLKAPWYSALAQGQCLSLLLRAWTDTSDDRFRNCADRAFESFLRPTSEGGVTYHWPNGDLWFEEYLLEPPTHILNGFIWALWGVYDYALATGSQEARSLFSKATQTLTRRLHHYDTGSWSLYDLSKSGLLKMLASPFYHKLHIVQLRIMERLTGESAFGELAAKWENYSQKPLNKMRALALKGLFKLLYY